MRGIVQQATAARKDLPIALAHRAMRVKPGTPDDKILARIYAGLNPRDRMRFHAEVGECKAAKRGERLADVVR